MRDQYRANADQAIAGGEYRKASELLWGAVTQQLKALAATYNIVITSHRQFFDFLRQLAAELGGQADLHGFRRTQCLTRELLRRDHSYRRFSGFLREDEPNTWSA
jgi:hypothetical protein